MLKLTRSAIAVVALLAIIRFVADAAFTVSVTGGRLDCQFGTVAPATGYSPTCTPSGRLKVISDKDPYVISVSYAVQNGGGSVRVLVDQVYLLKWGQSTPVFSKTDKNGRTHDIQYRLVDLFDVAPGVPYSVEVTITVTTQ